MIVVGTRTPAAWLYWTIASILWLPLRIWYRWHFRGVSNLPKTGPVILASNHISYLDPLAVGYLCLKRRRRASFLTKKELFEKGGIAGVVLKWALLALGQIPVSRGTESAAASLEDATRALEQGACVVVFPEGTISHETFEPMQPRTGVARLASRTGAPVVPAAVWGSHRAITKNRKPDFRPRYDISVYCGSAIMLDPEEDPRVGAERVMAAIKKLLDEAMLEYPYDPSPGEDWWLPPRYRTAPARSRS